MSTRYETLDEPRTSSIADDKMIQDPPSHSAIKRKPWPFIIIALILATAAVVIPVGVVVSSKAGDAPSASITGGKSSSSSASSRNSPNKANRPNLAPKPKWNLNTNKMIGLNLGNWLILERWMREDWFVEKAGPNAWDEWSFTLAQGANASAVLEEHWSTWVTEDDIEKVYEAGINTLRVATGFWMWIPTVAPEPYVTTGQLAHFERLCSYAYARNMYIILDLHGLPGSQNGEQQSGHNTTSPTFFQPLQQARSDQVVKAVVDWIADSPYYSIISAIEIINEPRPYTSEQLAMLRGYYERSYDTIQKGLGDKAPAMFFADGFVPGDKFAFWYDFANARKTDPPTLGLTDHPYPGYFPAQNNSADIMKQTCVDAAKYKNFPVPTVITEWSLRTGIQNVTFEKIFYATQLSAWSATAGSCFWSLRALDSKVAVLADPVAQYQWSFETLLARGSIPVPKDKTQSAQDFLKDLGNPCGPTPVHNPDAPPPQGTGAAVAVASARAAKDMVEGINKNVADAAVSFGLGGAGSAAVMTNGGSNPSKN